MNIGIADFRQNAMTKPLLLQGNNYPAIGVQLDVTDREGYVKAADEPRLPSVSFMCWSQRRNRHRRAEAGEGKFDYKDIDLAIDVTTSVLNGIMTIVPRIVKHGGAATLFPPPQRRAWCRFPASFFTTH
jgi:hypothetical protein